MVHTGHRSQNITHCQLCFINIIKHLEQALCSKILLICNRLTILIKPSMANPIAATALLLSPILTPNTAIQWMVHWPLMGELLHLVQRGGDRNGRGRRPPSPLLAVPHVTAHPSTASVITTYYSMYHYNCLWRVNWSHNLSFGRGNKHIWYKMINGGPWMTRMIRDVKKTCFLRCVFFVVLKRFFVCFFCFFCGHYCRHSTCVLTV